MKKGFINIIIIIITIMHDGPPPLSFSSSAGQAQDLASERPAVRSNEQVRRNLIALPNGARKKKALNI